MEIGLLILRIVVGALFVGHGAQKVFGWFDGPGPDGTGQFLGTLGYSRGPQMARLAGAAEGGAGILLVVGLATPLAAAAIIGVMVNVAVSAHLDNGLWNAGGGFELPLVYGTAALALAFTGPGVVSLDAAAGLLVTGWGPGLAALVVGLAVGSAVLATRETAEEEAPAAQEHEHAEARR